MLRQLLRVFFRSRAVLGWLLFPPAAALLIYLVSAAALWTAGPSVAAPAGSTPVSGADYGAWSEPAAVAEVTPQPTAPQSFLFDLLQLLGPQPPEGRATPPPTPTTEPPTAMPTAAPIPVTGGGSEGIVNPPPPVFVPTSTAPPIPSTQAPPTAVPPQPTVVFPPNNPPPLPTVVVPTVVVPTVAVPTVAVPTWTVPPPTVVFPVPTWPPLPTDTTVPLPTLAPTLPPVPSDTPLPPPTEPPPPTPVPPVVLCHRPPGNPDNLETKLVDVSEVPGHLAHGDTLGPCP